ncbi:MAG: hypothetical protein HZA95_02445 [Candidatus Vogelbacteria bacterium]|nr:hypothetical protein [Candidatus Vogelbacteria bacterium]
MPSKKKELKNNKVKNKIVDSNDNEGKTSGGSKLSQSLSEKTKHGILAILCLIISIFLVLSYVNVAGPAGQFSYYYLDLFFGAGYFLFPLAFLMLSWAFIKLVRPHIVFTSLLGGLIFFLSTLAMVDIFFRAPTSESITGGYLGHAVSLPFTKLFDPLLSLVILSAIVVVSILILFDTHVTIEPKLFGKRLWGEDEETDQKDTLDDVLDESGPIPVLDTTPVAMTQAAIDNKKDEAPKANKKKSVVAKMFGTEDEGGGEINVDFRARGQFTPPPLELLERDSGKPGVGDIKANANIIKRTLMNFGIDVEMDEISIGPSITRYAMKPAEGVKLSRIVALQNDLSLALAAHPLRIEAPIPGKALVGIEMPNTTKTIVRAGSIFGEGAFRDASLPLYIALGRSISGHAHFTNLAKAPHLLIAGATGSGKSVVIHTLIASLLYRNPPEDLRFIMIDPKRVELTLYNKIPHLLTPVITDAKKTILTLRWAAKEMDRRYDILEKKSVRDIQSYHKTIFEPSTHKPTDNDSPAAMPYIVIIIDELADIMSTYPRELEAAVVRLAQMSRAVGIHLVLSTQRPSTEVITGLIKANIPARLALQVPSQIDSRTIIDMPGAEKLLGSGDMLYLGADMSKPIRIQGAYITEGEVKDVVKYLSKQYEDVPPSEINLQEVSGRDNMAGGSIGGNSSSGLDDGGDDDELYEEAREAVLKAGKASSSYLQRKLKVGYARAARLLDILEERGVVGPGEGSKPREVYGGSSPQGEFGGGYSGNVEFDTLEKELAAKKAAEEENQS